MLELPLEGRLARKLGAPKPGDWTQETELLAGILELIHDYRNIFILSIPRKKGTPRPNLPTLKIPRPDGFGEQTRKKPATREEFAAWIAKKGRVRYHPKGEG